jgi:glycerol-3-phosphate acyltransferase PlsY
MTVAAYLIGSISFAVVSSKLFGLADPRTYGSKNPGATNVLRSGNKGAAIATLIGDALKGWLAVWLAIRFRAAADRRCDHRAGGHCRVPGPPVAGVLPLCRRQGRGDRGRCAAGLESWLGVATLVTWLAVAFAFRYSSLAALVAAVFAPFYYGLLFGVEPQLFAVFAMSALLVFRHSKNISNLIAGKESRIGSKAKGK